MKCERLPLPLPVKGSPPARGAWIEIVVIALFSAKVECRPPHGGRGLKSFHRDVNLFHHKSPPARGAWIEILSLMFIPNSAQSRPPHGGRGLKSPISAAAPPRLPVAPRTGGVD